MSIQDSEDRREYYRIDDQIALQIRYPACHTDDLMPNTICQR
ncbi:MAG: hypothetical protein PHF42_07140 [Pseudomonas sp.]|nr:hypothetical protein [Pseudomonas sp.]MDY0415092.1 hypothetical protein [Pseudomonas sp.]